MPNPIRAILQIRKNEFPLAALMFLYFFLVITVFWFLKPLKSSLFIQFYDQTGFDFLGYSFSAARAELLAKVLNMVVAFIAAAVFSWLSRFLRREQFTYLFSAFFMVCFVFYSRLIGEPSSTTVWTFYLLGDLFTTLMVTTFFAFLNDSVTPDRAKRLYGLIVLGGVMGGVLSPTLLSLFGKYRGATWLWICFGLLTLVVLVAAVAGRLVRRDPPPETVVKAPARETGTYPLVEGAQLIWRSRYLLSIAVIVGLYEITSQVLDFQFKNTVSHFLDGDAIRSHFNLIFAISNWVSMLVQIFLTSFVMSRFGLRTALLVLPVSIALGSAGFMILPILWTGSFLNTVDSGLAYSLNQSSKEALYVPVTREEKYRAKAFIDMFVQRFAKVLAIGVSLAITAVFTDFDSLRWLSVFTLVVVVVWVVAAKFAGRRFDELSGDL